jgi:membrane-associated phospholipid phosphatase
MGKKRKAIKKIEKADIAVSRTAWDYKRSAPVRALGWFGKLSDQPPLFAFAAGIAAAGLIRREPQLLRAAARMAIAHWIGIHGKNMLKDAVDRTRPDMLVEDGRYEVGPGRRTDKEFSSFPSGHTAGAVAVARALARDWPEAAVPAHGAAAASALARIAECDHFVSDTAAGAVIGAVAEELASALVDGVQASLRAAGSGNFRS